MAVIKRKVVDDLVKLKTSPLELSQNARYKDLGITETMYVRDKREVISLNKKRVSGHVDFISQIRTTYGSIASVSTEGVLTITSNGTTNSIVIPISNLRILKSLLWCSKSENMEYAYVLVEAFKEVLSQTINCQEASYDEESNPYQDKLQRTIYDEIMKFYIEKCKVGA